MLKTLDPLTKLAICLLWMAAAVFVFDLRFQLGVIACCVVSLIVLDRISPLLVAALMVPFALFGFGFLTTSVVFRTESDFALFVSAQSPFASPAFSAGITLFLRAIAIGMISALFALTTDPGALVRALMARWRLSPRIGYALFSVLQLVPDLADEAHRMRIARAMKTRRIPSRFPGPFEAAGLVVPLLAFAIRRANRSAIAMEARGLAAGRPRTIVNAPSFRRRDLAFMLIASGMLGFGLALILLTSPR